MLQKKKQKNIIEIGHKFLIIDTEKLEKQTQYLI